MNALKTAVLDALGNEEVLKPQLMQVLNEAAAQTHWFDLTGMSIQPCRSCGSCGLRTPGQCPVPYDMQAVLRAFAASQLIVYLTPVRFGGYSSDLKNAIDRLLPVGLSYYIVKGGHMLHPMRYGRKCFIGVGLSEDGNPAHEKNFIDLVKANAVNMLSDAYCLIYRSGGRAEKTSAELARVLKGIKIE